jgi:hypothetical protein
MARWVCGNDTSRQRPSDGGTLVQTVDYRYDSFQQRIEKVVTAGSTSTTRFAYDNVRNPLANVLFDLSSSGTLTTRRIFGIRKSSMATVNPPGGRIDATICSVQLSYGRMFADELSEKNELQMHQMNSQQMGYRGFLIWLQRKLDLISSPGTPAGSR